MKGKRIEIAGVRGASNWRRLALVLEASEGAEVVRIEGPADECGPRAYCYPPECRCGLPDGVRQVVVGVGQIEFRCRACGGLHSYACTGALT